MINGFSAINMCVIIIIISSIYWLLVFAKQVNSTLRALWLDNKK